MLMCNTKEESNEFVHLISSKCPKPLMIQFSPAAVIAAAAFREIEARVFVL